MCNQEDFVAPEKVRLVNNFLYHFGMFGFLVNFQDASFFLGLLVPPHTGFFECELLDMPCNLRKSLSFRAYGCLSVCFRLAGSFSSKRCLQPRRFPSFNSGDYVSLGRIDGCFHDLPR